MSDDETRRALDVARRLVVAGVPLFVAAPCPAECIRKDHRPGEGHGGTGFHLPGKWETSTPTVDVVDRWRPGWALGAVMGHAVDLLDVDPRNGGDATVAGLKAAGVWPTSYGQAATPSGGTHDFIAPLGVGSRDGVAAGLDVKGGRPDGEGRGFGFIAPTVRMSKVTGKPEPYRWLSTPDLDALAEGGDDSGEQIAEMVVTTRVFSPGVKELRTNKTGSGSGSADVWDDFWRTSPWADITGALAEGRHKGVYRLACALRGRGGWVPDDALRYMRAVVWPLIDQGQGGHPYTAAEFDVDVRDAFTRHGDGSGTITVDVHPADDREPSHLDRLRAALVDSAGLDGIPDPDPLIGDDILFRDCLVWMVGKPGSMKSFTALDIAACVATGEPWQTYPVRQGPVLFLVAEGVRGTKKRVRAWEKSMGCTMTNVYFLPLAVQSKNGTQWDAFVELARELRPALIVLDTQARVTVGVEENSNTEMGEFVHQAERLRIASGACVLVVHHIGRNGDTGRGATVLDGAMSTIVKVTKDDDRVSLECTKNKDGTEWETVTLRAVPTVDSVVLMLDDGTGRPGDKPGTTGPSAAAVKTAHTWWAHHRYDTVGTSKLLDVVAPKSTLYRHITELAEHGWLHVDRAARRPSQYRLLRQP